MFVSILIPVYNAEPWIGQAIESALAQTYRDLEVIVVDDGSTDRSLEIIKSYDGRIRWESGPNRGANHARNRLLAMARGKWLQYLDADDYLLETKVEQQAAVVAGDSSIDVLYGPAYTESKEGGKWKRELDRIPLPIDPWRLLVLWRLPQTGAPLWKRQALEDVGGWNEAQPVAQDFELYFRLLVAGKTFVYNEACGAVYRIWGVNTLSRSNVRAALSARLKITADAEQFLQSSGSLTHDRAIAVSQGRFDCARSVWSLDREWARTIFEEIRSRHPGFEPEGHAAPLHYRVVAKLLGFSGAERVAELKRQLSRRSTLRRDRQDPGYKP